MMREIIVATPLKGTTMRYLADTAEMPAWTGEQDAPRAAYSWGVYTELGEFVPRWHVAGPAVTYAARRDHSARHTPKARWGQMRKWAVNVWREAGEFLVGAFQPIRNAV
jgi:hypothetical protein